MKDEASFYLCMNTGLLVMNIYDLEMHSAIYTTVANAFMNDYGIGIKKKLTTPSCMVHKIVAMLLPLIKMTNWTINWRENMQYKAAFSIHQV